MEQTQTTFSFFITSKYKWANSITLGTFLYLFIAVFLPFGVSNYNPNHTYTLEFLGMLSSFMVATSIVAGLNEFFLKPLFVKRLSTINIIAWSVWLIFILGLTNFLLYNYLGEWHDFSWSSALDFILSIGSVLILPITGLFFYFRYNSLKFQYEQVLINRDTAVDHKALLRFQGQGNNEHIFIALEDFLYAKSQDNYVELYYVTNQSIQKTLVRATMSAVLEGVNAKWIARCHRSYMINLFNVRSIKGGSQTQLHLNHISQPIPVSSSFKSDLLNMLKKTKNFT